MTHQPHIPCARCIPLYETAQGPNWATLVVKATHWLQVVNPDTQETEHVYMCSTHAHLVPIKEVRAWEELDASGLDL